MKLFIPVEKDNGLSSNLDARFGRAGCFLIYNTEKEAVEGVRENPYKNVDHGAGIKAATLAVETGCGVVLGTQPGPKAAAILAQAGMKVVEINGGTAKEAVNAFQQKN